MNRRHFLYLSGVIPIAAVINTIPILFMNTPRHQEVTTISDASISHLFYLASLAPSSHNTQPWLLMQQDSPFNWKLTFDENRCLPIADPNKYEMLLSLGAFLENLILVGPIYGYEIQYTLSASEKLSIFIRLLKTKKTAETDIIAQIEKRRTLRKNLLNTPLTIEEQAYILNNTDSICFFPRDSDVAKQLAELTFFANKMQSQDKSIQQELSHWIRWKHVEQVASADGLTPDTMEMNFLVKWLAEYFFKPSDLLSPYFQSNSLALIKDQITEGAGWIIAYTNNTRATDFLSIGRCVQSLWLRCTKLGIALHPMSQALEEAASKNKLQQIFPSTSIVFIARIGHCTAYPAPVSFRRGVSKFIVKEAPS